MAELLSCRGVLKRFGGLTALSGVDLDLRQGEIVGLIGPNGAGKSTLVGVISGYIPVTEGQVSFKGQDVSGWPPAKVAAHGIRRTFQGANAFASLSLAENVLMGAAGRAWSLALRERASALLEKARLTRDLPTKALSAGQLRLLSVARAVIDGPDLLLLDEPAAGLSDPEVELMADMMQHVRESGTTVLVIEHNMEFVFRSCGRIVVLDQGRVIAEGTPDEIKRNDVVIEAYLGQRWERAVQ